MAWDKSVLRVGWGRQQAQSIMLIFYTVFYIIHLHYTFFMLIFYTIIYQTPNILKLFKIKDKKYFLTSSYSHLIK